AADHAESGVIGEAAVVLKIETFRRLRMRRDLVHALAELGERVGQEAAADAAVGRSEAASAVVAEVVAAGRDAEMDALPVAQDGVQAEAAGARRPLARVLVIGDPRDLLPGVPAVAAPEQRGRLDAGPDLLLPGAALERPDVGQRPPVVLGEG